MFARTTPFVNLFLVGAVSTESAHVAELGKAVRGLVVGAGVGVGFGLVGGWLLVRAIAAGWGATGFRPLASLGLALLAYGGSLQVDGNGFVAAFVAGMCFGSVVRDNLEEIVLFAERAGGLLGLLVWLLFGAVMVVPGFEAAPWQDYVFAVLALTVLRMVPVALSLIGSGLDRATVALVGWSGRVACLGGVRSHRLRLPGPPGRPRRARTRGGHRDPERPAPRTDGGTPRLPVRDVRLHPGRAPGRAPGDRPVPHTPGPRVPHGVRVTVPTRRGARGHPLTIGHLGGPSPLVTSPRRGPLEGDAAQKPLPAMMLPFRWAPAMDPSNGASPYEYTEPLALATQ